MRQHRPTYESDADLIALLTQDGVTLKRSGSDKFWAKCPFHTESKASFQVRLSRWGYWSFRCFSNICGLTGTARDYRRHTNRPPAASHEIPVRPATPRHQYDTPTREILTIAANHYNQQLLQHQEAMDYLLARGVNPEQAQQWGIGYAPGATLYRELAQQMSVSQLERCALVRHKHREDRLNRRIIIPNYRQDGSSDWHTGRAIDPDNSRPYMSVSGNRPPLLQLRDTPDQTVILVEGPFDLLAVLTAGYHGAATAGNPHVARLRQSVIRRQYRQLLLLPDRDTAGEKWADMIIQAFDEHRSRGPVIRTLRLPEYCADPAEALTQRQYYSPRATIATAIRTAYTGRSPPSECTSSSGLQHDPNTTQRSVPNMAYNNGPLIQFFGHLSSDPREIGESDNRPAAFSVAVNYRCYSSQERDWVDESEFFNCTSFRHNATQAMRLQKGDFIWISGSLQTREYEARDGTNRKALNVQVLDMHAFLSLTKRDNGDNRDNDDRDDDRNRRRDNDRGGNRSRRRDSDGDDDGNRSRGGDDDGGGNRSRDGDRGGDRGRSRGSSRDDDRNNDRGRGGDRGSNRGNDRGRGGDRGSSPPRGQRDDFDMDVDDLPF